MAKTKLSLGKSLIRDRFKRGKNAIINPDGSLRHTFDPADDPVNMKSITHENDLEAFLTTATLAGTDFIAEKLNLSLVVEPNANLLTEEQERETEKLHSLYKESLTIPRRPAWDLQTTPEQLATRESISFLDWRRGLVILEEDKGLLMTPYERNLEVWKQLWRVIERSQLIVQIVDGRNPLLFRCADVDIYVKEVDIKKKCLLLVNKADLLTTNQRMKWADYFIKMDIPYIFFSAAMAKQSLEEDEYLEKLGEVGETDLNNDEEVVVVKDEKKLKSNLFNQDGIPPKARISGALELLDKLKLACPTVPSGKITVGFVGYPNVGKSSTMNALVGAKKCSVGSTPGKTKHFQTIHISDSMILCDCPGLVFPSFATTKADMVVNGVLPIDQLREVQGPAGLVAQRIPKYYLEAIYGINIKTRNVEGELVCRTPTASEFLCAYAIARGYTKASQGNPDESRAARYILKDYVGGKLLYIQPPPGINAKDFNAEMYENKQLLERQIKMNKIEALQTKIQSETTETELSKNDRRPVILNARAVDQQFFKEKIVHAKTNGNVPINDFYRVDLNQVRETMMKGSSDKKHKKGKRHVKTRTNWTLEDN